MTHRFFLLLALGFAFAAQAFAQYPNRAVKIVPHAPAGSGPDMIARLLASGLQESMGQPVVVENRAGANGNIAGEFVARSPADGYTLLIATDAQFTINPHVYAKLAFDWNKDLTPVSSVATESFKLVVASSVPARTVAEFIAHVRSLPKPLFYGSAGNGSQHHLTMELFKERAGISLTHIPYKGGGAATTQALLTGEIQATIGGAAVDVQVKAGKLRALGIAGATRSPRYPDLPTIGETIPGFEMSPWYGLFAPTGTHADIITRLRVETNKYLSQPEAQAKINASGPEVWMVSPDAFASVIRRDFERNGKLVRALGVSLD
jgi:tripartite-type tricarboxylate transporter receptor subunit TctC